MFDKGNYTVEQKMITDFVNKVAKEFDFEYFFENMKNETPPAKYWKVLGKNEYFGLLAPEAHGGSEFKAEDLVVFFDNLSKKGLLSHQIINQMLCCTCLTQYGNTEQQTTYLPRLIAGKRCGYAVMEQSEGTSLFDTRVEAIKEGDAYRLNGAKNYVVGAGATEYFIVSAKTSKNMKNGISLFLIDAKNSGVSLNQKELSVRVSGENDMMTITGDTFWEVRFNDVELSSGNLLGKENAGAAYIDQLSGLQMIMLAAMSIGWGEKLLDMGAEHARNRAIFQDPIGSYQAIQHPMARAKTDLELAKLATERAVLAYDNNEDPENVSAFTSIAKYAATEAAYNACDISMQAHGGTAFDRDMGIICLYPLILLSRIIPLNNDVILERFSETVLGLPVSDLH